MAYTEVKKRNEKKYFYRVLSVRNGKKVSKKRKYLGINLNQKEVLLKEKEADKEFYLERKNKKERDLDKIKPKIIEILKKHKIKKAGIFGSYSTGKAKENSDIDILVLPPEGIGFGFVGIQMDLEKALKKKVDLISYRALHPLLKKRVLNEEIKIL